MSGTSFFTMHFIKNHLSKHIVTLFFFFFAFQKRFWKKLKIFNLFIWFKLIYIFFFRSLWCNDFKNYFNVFSSEKHFKKQPQLHSQTPPLIWFSSHWHCKPWTLYFNLLFQHYLYHPHRVLMVDSNPQRN